MYSQPPASHCLLQQSHITQHLDYTYYQACTLIALWLICLYQWLPCIHTLQVCYSAAAFDISFSCWGTSIGKPIYIYSKKRLCCFDQRFVILVAWINNWNVLRYFKFVKHSCKSLEHCSVWGPSTHLVSSVNEHFVVHARMFSKCKIYRAWTTIPHVYLAPRSYSDL